MLLWLFRVVIIKPRFAFNNLIILLFPIFTLIDLSLDVSMYSTTPSILVKSLTAKTVASENSSKCTFTGNNFKSANLEKVRCPPFVCNVSLSRFVHFVMLVTKFTLFETLFVEHVSNKIQLFLICLSGCVKAYPLCHSSRFWIFVHFPA